MAGPLAGISAEQIVKQKLPAAPYEELGLFSRVVVATKALARRNREINRGRLFGAGATKCEVATYPGCVVGGCRFE